MLGWAIDLLKKSDKNNNGISIKFKAEISAKIDLNRLIDQIHTLTSSKNFRVAQTVNYSTIKEIITLSQEVLKKDGAKAFKIFLEKNINFCQDEKKAIKINLYLVDSLSFYDPESAISLCRNLRDEYPTNFEAGFVIAQCFIRAGMIESALYELERVSEKKDAPKSYLAQTEILKIFIKSKSLFEEEKYVEAKNNINNSIAIAKEHNLFDEINLGYVHLFTISKVENDWNEANKIFFEMFKFEHISDIEVLAAMLNCAIIREMNSFPFLPYNVIKKSLLDFKNFLSLNTVVLFINFGYLTIFETAEKSDIDYSLKLLESCNSLLNSSTEVAPPLLESVFVSAQLKAISYDLSGAYNDLQKMMKDETKIQHRTDVVYLTKYLIAVTNKPLSENTDLLLGGRPPILSRAFQFNLLYLFHSILVKDELPNESLLRFLSFQVSSYYQECSDILEKLDNEAPARTYDFLIHNLAICKLIILISDIMIKEHSDSLRLFSFEHQEIYDELLGLLENNVFFWEPIKSLQICLTLTCLCEHEEVRGDRERVALRFNEYLKEIEKEDEWTLLGRHIIKLEKRINSCKGKPFRAVNIVNSMIDYPLDILMPLYGGNDSLD